jgi:DNA (cytosine-5)-methyltransferase 1
MRQPSVISLFTGAGGLDLGFEAAGLRTAAAVELDPTACATLRANQGARRGWTVLNEDTNSLSHQPDRLLTAARLRAGEPEVLIGGPPCQPFSKSGYWNGGDAKRLDDPRASTLDDYFRIVEGTRPRSFLLENVAGMRYVGKSEGLEHVELLIAKVNAALAPLGMRYEYTSAVLDAADFGAPQHRTRFFLVGWRVDGGAAHAGFTFPEPTHAAPGTDEVLSGLRQRYRTTWDAFAPLERPHADEVRGLIPRSSKYAELLPYVPEGDNYLYFTTRRTGDKYKFFGWRTRYWSFLLKLAKNQPSWTITASPGPAIGPFHWSGRRLTSDELMALQTFPHGYRIEGTPRDVLRQLGNAVPSLMGEILAREIRRQILGHRVRTGLKLLPDDAPTPAGRAKRKHMPCELIAKYRNEHVQDHPGEGRGPGAVRRGSS